MTYTARVTVDLQHSVTLADDNPARLERRASTLLAHCKGSHEASIFAGIRCVSMYVHGRWVAAINASNQQVRP